MVNDDFDLTEEILAIMDGLDGMPVCCRTNLLKMTAAWERDMVALRSQRDKGLKAAKYWKARYLREIGEPS